MDEFIIIPFQSVGDISFGMKQEDVINLFKRPPDSSYVDFLKRTDLRWDNLSVKLNKKGVVNEVTFVPGQYKAVYDSINLLENKDAVKLLNQKEKPLKSVGYKIYLVLGIAITDDKAVSAFSFEAFLEWRWEHERDIFIKEQEAWEEEYRAAQQIGKQKRHKEESAGENVMEVYRYTDEKSDKFWRIEYAGNDFAVNYGKTGSTGKYQIKEFDNAEECEKAVKKLIASKVKEGYQPYPEFDENKQLYFDDGEIGLHPLTSHPRFRAHFTDEFYYDCGDEEAPFGSDEGSDTLAELQDYIKKNREIDLYKFPRHVMADVWDMPYLPPDSLELTDIKAIIAQPDDTIPMSQHLMINDQVIIASAIGQIKVMGEVSLRLKALALRAMKRLLIVAELKDFGFSEITKKMMGDLERFQNPPQSKPTEMAQTLMGYLACPCEIFNGLLDDDDLIYSYEQAQEEGKAQGYTPLLVVVDDTLVESVTLAIDEDSDMDFDPEKVKAYREKTIAEALTLNPVTVLKNLMAELEEDEKSKVGPVKGGRGINRFSAFWDHNAPPIFKNCSPTKEVILAKLPTRNPWELAVWVPMGGFNDCPTPEQQAAVMKYWYEKYGAIPGVVTYDEWEFMLSQPIADKDEALKLANEHYSFCYDRVEQYDGDDYTVGKLADCLMKSTVWYFWWD